MIKQNPFSLYDFLGYFIPGALITYLIILINTVTNIGNINIQNFESGEEFQFDKFLFFTIVSYSVGHLLNFLSSITIERYANWKYNYPSKYLLNFIPEHKFWVGSKIVKIWKVILSIFLFPIIFFDFFLGHVFGFKNFYTKRLDDFLVSIIKEKGLILINQLTPSPHKGIKNKDFHRIFAHYTYENSKNHQSKLSNYVALYGFLRSVTLICNISFWYLVIYIIKIFNTEHLLSENWEEIRNFVYFLFALSIVTYIYFMAFMKFYRRYSLEALMLIAIDKNLVVENEEIKD